MVAILITSAVGLHFGGSFVKSFMISSADKKEDNVNTKRVF